MGAAYSYEPLTESNWKDFELLFGSNGACGGCWCMYWKLKRSEFTKSKGTPNRKRQEKIVRSGLAPGIVLYEKETPVGWCAVEPRENYPVMKNSRVMRPIDDLPVWSISCFFINKDFRKKGLSVKLLEFAKEHCKKNGATIVEGYPYEVHKPTGAPFIWTGVSSAFRKAGFKEVARYSPTRPIMRFYL